MPLQLVRAVRNPQEGLYAFRFELRTADNHPFILTTDFNGNGLYRILRREPRNGTGPSEAWRTLCLAAGQPWLIADAAETATEIAAPTQVQLARTLLPCQAAAQLMALQLEKLDAITAQADTLYLDGILRHAYKISLTAGG